MTRGLLADTLAFRPCSGRISAKVCETTQHRLTVTVELLFTSRPNRLARGRAHFSLGYVLGSAAPSRRGNELRGTR